MDDMLLLQSAIEALIDGADQEAAHMFRQLAEALEDGDCTTNPEDTKIMLEGLLEYNEQ